MNSSGAEGSVKSLKAQLREAQAEVAAMSDKFGETSVQAANAARKAADLKDRIGDAKALTEAFNPDQKFKAFSTALQGVVGGFAALQGAQALFGVKSEELEKTLLKVQGAMALSQGLSAITESIDAFKNLKTVAVATFNSIRTAIGSTGIGVLVIAIGAVVAAMMEYVNESSAVEQATKRMKEEEERYKKSLEETADEIQRRNQISDYLLQKDLTNAKARGASVKELRKIETDYFTQKIIDAEEEERLAKKNTEVNKEKYGTENQIYKDSVKALKDRTSEREKLYQQYYLRLAQFDLEDYEKRQAKEKERKEKEKERIKKANQDKLDLQKEIERLLKEREANRLTQEIHTEQLIQEARLSVIKDGYTKRQQEIENARQKEIDNELDLLSKGLISQEQYNTNREAIDTKYNAQRLQASKDNAEAQKKIDEEKFNNQKQLLEKSSEIFSQFSSIVGKETVAGKALGIASATMDTYIAANKALKADYSVFGPAAQVARFASVAATIGLGIKNIKEIARVKVPGGGGGSVPSGLSATAAPIGTQMGATALQQAQINAAGNAAVQAFVLESDVSGNQERIERLNRAARIQ